MKKPWKLPPLLLAIVLALGLGCTMTQGAASTALDPSLTPESAPGRSSAIPAAPATAPSTQPRMQRALASLKVALGELKAAKRNKGEYQGLAVANVEAAIANTEAGMAYADSHKVVAAKPTPQPIAVGKVKVGTSGSSGTLADMFQKMRNQVQGSN